MTSVVRVRFFAFLSHQFFASPQKKMNGESKTLTYLHLTVPKFQGENFYKNRAIRDEIRKLAARKGCKTTQIALAWVAEQGLIAIPGTTKPHRLEENWASRDIVLTAEEKKELRRIIEEAKPVGDRYPPDALAMTGI